MEAKFLDIGGSKTLRLAARESAEAAIEGALPLPAGIRLGDIEPLCAAARVEAAAAAAHDGRIDIEGKLKVSVIFRNAVREMIPSGDGADNAEEDTAAAEKGGAFTSGAAFKYSIACDAAREGMRAEVTAYVTSCTLSAAGELMLSAVAGLDCAVYDTSPLPMLNGIDGAECEMKHECICTCTEALIGQSETDFETETALPAGTEPLFASGECSVRSVTPGGDTAIIEGQLCLDLLLCSRAGLTAHAVQFPFTIEAELDSRAEGDAYATVSLKDIYISPADASSGIAAVRARLAVSIYQTEQSETAICTDAFIPYHSCQMQTESASIMQRMRRKTFRYTLSENIPLPDGTGGAKSAICCAAMPYVTTAEVKNGVLSIEGIITLNCALRTAEPNALTFASQLPFLCETQYTGADAEAADASVKCLSCTLMLTGGMLTAECVLELSAVPYTLTGMTIVSAAGEAAGPRCETCNFGAPVAEVVHLRLVFLHSMSEFYQFTRNLPHKPGYTVILRLPTYHTLLCTGQCQLLHGTGNAYIAQAALFFHVGRIS